MSKELIKVGLETSNNILLEIYGDLMKPGVSQVGKAIGTIIGLGNTILMPLALKNEKSKLTMQNNLDKYRQKLESIPEENIQAVVPEIGVPILEKLMYVSDDTLVDLYTELLVKASDKNQCSSTHPSFVNVINNLSPIEAQVLELINEYPKGIVDISIKTIKNYKPYAQISEFILNNELYDNNFSAYLSNLVGLGLIEISFKKSFSNKAKYDEIEGVIKDIHSKIPEILIEDKLMLKNLRDGNINFNRGIIKTTDFGRLFLFSCTDKEQPLDLYTYLKNNFLTNK